MTALPRARRSRRERQRIADFCAPYVVSGQSLVVDPSRHPNVHGIADLKGLVIGVQQGNTSQPVADKLVAEHRAARVRVYAYDEIGKALDDLSTGGCDAFMKLAPVTEWFVRDRPKLAVVETGITRERLGICVRKGNTALRECDRQGASVADGGRHADRADQAVARQGRDRAGVSQCRVTVARRPSHIQRVPVLMRAGFGFGADPDRQRGVCIPTGGFQDYGAARGALLGFSVFQLLLEFL